ncbi:uncharacterized protein METZ01_LOCUS479428, partial [marine metagenome]
GIFLDGVDLALENLEWGLSSNLSIDLPIVGEKLGSAAEFLRDMRLGLLAELKEKVSGDGKLVEVARDAIFDVVGPAGLDFMLDADDDGSVTVDDVLVGWFAKDGALLRKWQLGEAVPEEADSIQFDLKLGDSALLAGVDIPLELDLPGFDLSLDGGLALSMDWSLDLGFGLSVSDGFYLATNVDPAEPEFEVKIRACLDGDPTDPDVSSAFSGEGKLLFFDIAIDDLLYDPSKGGGGGVFADL